MFGYFSARKDIDEHLHNLKNFLLS